MKKKMMTLRFCLGETSRSGKMEKLFVPILDNRKLATHKECIIYIIELKRYMEEFTQKNIIGLNKYIKNKVE